MKITITNKTANPVSTDLGVLNPWGTLSDDLSPDEMYETGRQLKPLVDDNIIAVSVSEETASLPEMQILVRTETAGPQGPQGPELPPIYVRRFSTMNQIPIDTNPLQVTFDGLSVISGMTNVGNSIRVDVAGTYILIVRAHISRASTGGTTLVDIWPTLNDQNTINSATRAVIRAAAELDSISLFVMFNFEVNDVVKIWQRVDTTTGSSGLYAIDDTPNIPIIPSVTLLMYRISSNGV